MELILEEIRNMILDKVDPPFRLITRWQAAEMLTMSAGGFDKIVKKGYKSKDGLVYFPEKEGSNYTYKSVAKLKYLKTNGKNIFNTNSNN